MCYHRLPLSAVLLYPQCLMFWCTVVWDLEKKPNKMWPSIGCLKKKKFPLSASNSSLLEEVSCWIVLHVFSSGKNAFLLQLFCTLDLVSWILSCYTICVVPLPPAFFNLAIQEVQMSFEGKQLLQDLYLVFNIGVYKAWMWSTEQNWHILDFPSDKQLLLW